MKVKIKRGKEISLPILDDGELAFTLDTKKLFIGTGAENVSINGTEMEQSIQSSMGKTNDPGGTITTGSIFAKLNTVISKLSTHMSSWTSTRAAKIDAISESTKAMEFGQYININTSVNFPDINVITTVLSLNNIIFFRTSSSAGLHVTIYVSQRTCEVYFRVLVNNKVFQDWAGGNYGTNFNYVEQNFILPWNVPLKSVTLQAKVVKKSYSQTFYISTFNAVVFPIL